MPAGFRFRFWFGVRARVRLRATGRVPGLLTLKEVLAGRIFHPLNLGLELGLWLVLGLTPEPLVRVRGR